MNRKGVKAAVEPVGVARKKGSTSQVGWSGTAEGFISNPYSVHSPLLPSVCPDHQRSYLTHHERLS